MVIPYPFSHSTILDEFFHPLIHYKSSPKKKHAIPHARLAPDLARYNPGRPEAARVSHRGQAFAILGLRHEPRVQLGALAAKNLRKKGVLQ